MNIKGVDRCLAYSSSGVLCSELSPLSLSLPLLLQRHANIRQQPQSLAALARVWILERRRAQSQSQSERESSEEEQQRAEVDRRRGKSGTNKRGRRRQRAKQGEAEEA